MKKVISLLFFMILLSACKKDDMSSNSSSVCTKTTVINTNIQDVFSSVYFLNGKDGFVTGYNGGIYKTSDSAKTWTTLNSTTNLPIRDIYFSDTNNGIAVGGENSCSTTDCISSGFILRTQDGGQTWKNVFTTSNKEEITSIYFINNLLGFCVGGRAVYKTTDGGQSWTGNPLSNIGGGFIKIEFSDTQNGFIISGRDILKTTDGGNSWQFIDLKENRKWNFYSLSSANKTIYVAGQGKILKSIDNGTTWSELGSSPSEIYYIHFTTQDIGYAFGRGNYSGGDFGFLYGSMYCTDNGGKSWNGNGNFADVNTIEDISFPTSEIGYAVSRNKVVKIVVD